MKVAHGEATVVRLSIETYFINKAGELDFVMRSVDLDPASISEYDCPPENEGDNHTFFISGRKVLDVDRSR